MFIYGLNPIKEVQSDYNMVLYGAGTEVPTRLIHELTFPVVDVWSGKGGTKSNFNNLSNKVITTYLRETMTEQNATFSAMQLCLRPQLQLRLHIIHPNSLRDSQLRYLSSAYVVHMAVITRNKIKIAFHLIVICYFYMLSFQMSVLKAIPRDHLMNAEQRNVRYS
jgi:hypothetical protein